MTSALPGVHRLSPATIAGYDLHFYNWNIEHPDDTPTSFDRAGWDP